MKTNCGNVRFVTRNQLQEIIISDIQIGIIYTQYILLIVTNKQVNPIQGLHKTTTDEPKVDITFAGTPTSVVGQNYQTIANGNLRKLGIEVKTIGKYFQYQNF